MEKESQNYFKVFRAHIERFGRVKNSEMNEISEFFTLQKVKKKELILQSGEICRFENFVVSGLFQTAIIDELGKTHTLIFLTKIGGLATIKVLALPAQAQ